MDDDLRLQKDLYIGSRVRPITLYLWQCFNKGLTCDMAYTHTHTHIMQ